jgi:peptidoglycan/xylan/chitin deacetylase (PgdA/CDA1 family)
MEKYGAKGTLYLVIDRHDRDWSTQKKAHHNSGELVMEPKLSDQQVRRMLESGVWELGGHTETHANLAVISDQDKQREVCSAKDRLAQQFNTEITSFAYPFGIYMDDDPELVCASGYTNAVTTVEGINTSLDRKRFELDRIKISGKDNFFAFICRIRTGKRGLKK